ncbi:MULTISPECIES: IS607 family transposase [Moorena]|uniref:IS607 family transposase n=1 Tax=Moorena TaxID=1155738 RepID=UPI001E540C4A|nr:MULTISPECIES: IS607 family transposase [Moorena]
MRKYADNGTIDSLTTEGGHRLFDVENYIKQSKPKHDYTICYCRVSSTKQRDDLDREIAYMHSLPDCEIIKDIGSGLNFKRFGLKTILDRLMRGDQFTLIVACRDRLARFGFELVQYLVESNGGKIVVLDNHESCLHSELVADLLSIVHLFSCRVH